MTTIVVIGCGKAKVTFRAPMVDLYTGSLYRARLELARAMGGPHYVLSAYHGCCVPTRPEDPYEFSIRERIRSGSWRSWANTVRDRLLRATRPGDRVVLLASAEYIAGWSDELVLEDRHVETPLAGLGIGQQIKRCHELTAEFADVVQLTMEI